jgi:hypothetical protein
MKIKGVFLFCCSLILLSGCKKDQKSDDNGRPKWEELKPVQKSLLLYFGGTWNEACGVYAKSALSHIKNNNGNDVVVVACHQSSIGVIDSLASEASTSMAHYFSQNVYPSFLIATRDAIDRIPAGPAMHYQSSLLIANRDTAMPSIYGKPQITRVNDSLRVKVETQFLKTEAVTYKISVWLTESYLQQHQVGDVRTVEKDIHHDVLRLSITESVTGEILADNVVKNEKKTKEWTSKLPKGVEVTHCNVVVVYWKLVEGKYEIANTEQVRVL